MKRLQAIRSGAVCPACGPDNEHVEFCEDCGPSDCVFCGTTTHRCLLSENLACADCEGGLS